MHALFLMYGSWKGFRQQKNNLQGHSKSMVLVSGHIRFPSSLPLQLGTLQIRYVNEVQSVRARVGLVVAEPNTTRIRLRRFTDCNNSYHWTRQQRNKWTSLPRITWLAWRHGSVQLTDRWPVTRGTVARPGWATSSHGSLHPCGEISGRQVMWTSTWTTWQLRLWGYI